MAEQDLGCKAPFFLFLILPTGLWSGRIIALHHVFLHKSVTLIIFGAGEKGKLRWLVPKLSFIEI